MTTDKNENMSYWDGLPEHIEVLEEAEEKHPPKPKAKDYRKIIQQRAEWKLRRKSPDKPKPTPTPTTPKAPSTAPSKPRSDHGEAPQAPTGQSYYWAEPSKSNKGGPNG